MSYQSFAQTLEYILLFKLSMLVIHINVDDEETFLS